MLSGPVKEIAISEPEQPVIDMTGIDLSLEPASPSDIPEMMKVVRRCYSNTEEIDALVSYFDFERRFNMPDCTYYYKIMQNGEFVGVVNLAYVGMEAMLIRNIAYMEPNNNIYIFKLLKKAL